MSGIQIKLFLLWSAVVISFAVGIYLPIATVEKVWILQNTFSLLGSLVQLAKDFSNWGVFLVILCFTILFPIAKIITMFLQIKHKDQNWQNRATKILETVGHFSMVDVFVIALMVLLLKLKVLVEVKIEAGFYVFTASIVLSILLSFIIKSQRNKQFTGD